MDPKRPPRKFKSDAAPQGLLIKVVRTLVVSHSESNREAEKARLTDGYNATDDQVNRLIVANSEQLTKTLQSFRRISQDVTDARERIRNVKNNLGTCKALLYCKREDLRKLWVDCTEQRHVLEILNEIDALKNVQQEINVRIAQKHFLKSSSLIVEALSKLDGDLSHVQGLTFVKDDLKRLVDECYLLILEEIQKQLYLKQCEQLLHQLKHIKQRQDVTSQMTDVGSLKSLSGIHLKATVDDSPVLNDNGTAYEDLNISATENQNPVQYMAILVEALTRFGMVPNALHHIKHNIQNDLQKIIAITSAFVFDHFTLGHTNKRVSSATALVRFSDGAISDAQCLGQLLSLLFQQFKSVATLHHLLIGQFDRVDQQYDLKLTNDMSYTISDVWNQIQVALQSMLSQYLDLGNAMKISAGDDHQLVNLDAQFGRRKPNRPKLINLFRFSATKHSVNVAEHAKQQKLDETPRIINGEVRGSDEANFVCTPNPNNVVMIYKPLAKFMLDIESKLELHTPCKLRLFLETYITDSFLFNFRESVRVKLSSQLQLDSNWKSVIAADEMKRLEVKIPLLASTVTVIDLCGEMVRLINNIPTFIDRFAEIWLEILRQYHMHARMIHQRNTSSTRQTDGESERRKTSATWAADDDISRLLKSLPNWLTLVESVRLHSFVPNALFSPSAANTTPGVESSEQVRHRNERESELLIGNLGSLKQIDEREIFDKVEPLKELANMHESLEYFADSVRHMLQALHPSILKKFRDAVVENRELGEKKALVDELEAHLFAIDDMSSICLLILHLEVRVHCFYYLLPIATQDMLCLNANVAQEIDPMVLSLNRNLMQVNDILKANLKSRKVRYVFEGLGHLVSSIFIKSAGHLKKINDNGKKRVLRNIFSIQQCLSNITVSREPDLDQARKYFELLYKNPDDILNEIVESRQFTRAQYSDLITLSVRSNAALEFEIGALDSRLTRLRQIFDSN